MARPKTTSPKGRSNPIPSPKQQGGRAGGDWYPYYAGYPEAFVSGVIDRFGCGAKSVIDPWSGSGTTGAVAARLGLDVLGIDLNPVLTIIAKGRMSIGTGSRASLDLVCAIESAAPAANGVQGADLLERWFTPRSAAQIRSIRAEILRDLSVDDTPQGPIGFDALASDRCFALCCLFLAVRDILRPFRGTNPTWIQFPESQRNRLRPTRTAISARFRSYGDWLYQRLRGEAFERLGDWRFVTASATAMPVQTDSFDMTVTSPPYATRIDYVRGSLPELAVLGFDMEAVDSLRRRTTGGPTVRNSDAGEAKLLSGYGLRLTKKIAQHSSKGSRGYYGPWIHRYLGQLQAGLRETSRVTRSGGPVCIVVQDSFYKELHIDLQRIVSETMSELGRSEVHRVDFRAPNVRSRMNPRARAHRRRRQHHETLLIFE